MSRPTVRYYATVHGEERVVDLTETDGGVEIVLDGRRVDADLTLLSGTSLHSLLLDGHSREMVLRRDGDRTIVSLDGENIAVLVQDEVSRALARIVPAAGSGASEVVAPMPGVVVDVPVAAGDEIEAGQAVVVMEAMKMQNELSAEIAGVIERVAVRKGDTVDGGDVLAVIRPKDVA